MAIPVVGLGAGGHARVLIEALRSDTRYQVVGLLDFSPELHGQQVSGVSVLGDDNLIDQLARRGICRFFVGVGGVGDNAPRRKLYEMARAYGLEPVAIVHPRSWVSPTATLFGGVVVLAGAIVNTDAVLGENVIVNSGAIVEHDCVIGNHVHVATGARLAGNVRVADSAHIGIGAVVRQSISIGANAIVGAGAVVVDDVPADTVVVGVPARPIDRKEKNGYGTYSRGI